MVYVRGHAADYDRWATADGAGDGWSYAAVLPYFRRAQMHQLGDDGYRGGDGPLYVSRGRSTNPLYRVFVEAGRQAGYAETADFNGYRQEGFGAYDMTVRDGERWSTATGYLRPVVAERRKWLSVVTGALATRVLYDGKKQAVGVECRTGGGSPRRAHVTKEVILSDGAINTPQLLMLSGVGDGDALKRLGIDVVHHAPDVGANLQDHLDLFVQHRCTQPITLYHHHWRVAPRTMIGTGVE